MATKPYRQTALPTMVGQDYGCQKVIAGESDWNLSDKNQPAGDGLFIKNILDTIKKALAGMPGLEDWLNKRYEQLAAARTRDNNI